MISAFGVSTVRVKWSGVNGVARACRLNELIEGTWREKATDVGDMVGKRSRERERRVREDIDIMRMGWGHV